MKRKPVIIVTAVAAIITAVAWWYVFRAVPIPADKVFVSGNIEATEVSLSFRISGQIKTLSVKEGDRVEQGHVISTLDTDSLEAMRGAATAEIATLQAVLDELEEGTRKEQIEMARALLKAADSRKKNALDEYERYLQLFKEKAVSQSSFDVRETSWKVAIEEYNNALQRLMELEKGPREQQIRAARTRLERAVFELNKIQLDIEHSTLTAPVSGVVLVKSNEIGEVVLPGATVVTMAMVDEVWLKGYVGEMDLGRIKLGQKAEIKIDTFPEKTYPGSLTFISSRAEFTPKNVQTREERVKQVYRVKVTMPNLHQDLKIGMPAEGYILTKEPTKSTPGE